MMVCDICWSPAPEFSGLPRLEQANTGNYFYVFGPSTTPKGAVDLKRIELCKTCIILFQKRDFQGVADRAHEALIRQVEPPGASA